MAPLAPNLQERVHRLLLALPQWEDPSARAALMGGILRNDYNRWYEINDFTGSSQEAADRFLGQADPLALRLLLAGLHQRFENRPDHCRDIEALQAAVRDLLPRRPRVAWNSEPYPGLNYFDRDDAPIFFGRDAEVAALLEKVTTTEQGRRFTIVLGASGAGKSSLVRAGLWERLARSEPNWLITAMKPWEVDWGPEQCLRAALPQRLRAVAASAKQGSLAQLAEQLLPAGHARWLLILDQMEELFAPLRQEEGQAFLERVVEAAHARQSRFQVVATLRADFYHHLLAYPGLQQVLNAGGTFSLAAPGRLALEEMVRGPIEDVQLADPFTVDARLPALMAADADAERQSGGLALMAFALRELYDRCASGRRLDVATYQSADFGGLSGAIQRRAEATLAALGAGGEAALPAVFSRLVRVNPDGAATRVRARRSAWQDDRQAARLVDAFVDARLLVADRDSRDAHADPIIEVAHEALLDKWPRLKLWIDERREAFLLRERVITEANAWRQRNPQPYSGRPWSAEVIEDARARLQQAGLLEPLLDGDTSGYLKRLLTPEAEWILDELDWPTTGHLRRWEIGRRLAEIGDPRPGVGVVDGVPDILWRDIPGGTVEVEKLGLRQVPPFRMATFPVTIAQFRAFVDADDGYGNDLWWEGLQREQPNDAWRSPLGNHPVTDVSWYDATAFCRWLSAKRNQPIRLPDEWEWQWAAQSARANYVYPWGPQWRADAANTSESDIKRTTAVGIYPPGKSDQQVFDLAGNVWEWCRNLHSDKEGEEGSRVLRGGSWYDDPEDSRADSRGNFRPGYRNSVVGFRVVCSSPIADH